MGPIYLLFLGMLVFSAVGIIRGFKSSTKIDALQKEIRFMRTEIDRLGRKVGAGETTEASPPSLPETKRVDAPPAAVKPPAFMTPVSPPSEVEDLHEEIPAWEAVVKSIDEDKEKAPVQPGAIPPVTPTPQEEKKPAEPTQIEIWKEQWLSRFEGMNWETIIGTYIVPRLGALGITIAVFIVLALAAQKYGAGFRVMLGYGVSAALMAGAYYTEKKFKDYSRVLFSAGLAMAYFVTFATHFLSFSQIFENPLPSLAGMSVIVGIWAAIAQKRRSPTVAMLVTLLGHFTISLSVFSMDEPAYYAGFGIVLLSVGSAFFLLRNGWYYIAAVGMVASYMNHAALLWQLPGNDTKLEFVIGMSVLVTYLLIFSLSEIYAPERLRREKIPNWFRSLFVTVNTACFFVLASVMVKGHTFSHGSHYLLCYALGATLIGLGTLYYFRRGKDPLYNIYFTKGVTMLTLGLAVQFSGNSLTTWLAIEMIVLLISAHRSGLVVTRVLAHAVALCTFVHGVYMCLHVMDFQPYDGDRYTAIAIQSGVSVVAFWVMSVLYQTIDWSGRMRLGVKIPRELQGLFWRLDLIGDPPKNEGDSVKPLGGLLYPYVYALLGLILCVGYARHLVEMPDRFNLYAILAAVLLAVGWQLKSRPLTLSSLGLIGLTILNSLYIQVDGDFPVSNIVGIVALALCALATDTRFLPNRDALVVHRQEWAPYALYGTVLWSLAQCLTGWFVDMELLGALLILSTVWAGLSLALHSKAVSLGAVVCFVTANIMWHAKINGDGFIAAGETLDSLSFWVGLIAIVFGVGGDRFFKWKKITEFSALCLGVVFATGWHLIHIEIPSEWAGVAMVGMAVAFLVYAGWSEDKTAGVLSVLSLSVASLGHVNEVYRGEELVSLLPLVSGFIACVVLWGLLERLVHRVRSAEMEHYTVPMSFACIAAVSVLSLCMLERIPALADFYLTVSWSVLGVVLFGLALGTQQKFYRYAGLSVLCLAIGRVVFIDTSDLEGMHRVFAYGGLGVILLLLGLGYAKAFIDSPKKVIDREQGEESE